MRLCSLFPLVIFVPLHIAVPENYGCVKPIEIDNFVGRIAGVIFLNTAPASESETMLNVILTSRPSARWLEETKTPSTGTIIKVALVRMILAWITGIVLIIATLLGVRPHNKNLLHCKCS